MRSALPAAALSLALGTAAMAQPAPSMQLGADATGAAVETCNANGFAVSAVVVDSAGAPVAESEGAGASPALQGFATRKARTAALFQMPSGQVAARAKTDPAVAARLAADKTFLTWAGGVPIVIKGQVVGAIGVGGAPDGDKDEACARAALAKVAGELK
jgi:uncharacterized protein GlcG (DUF336 family)